MRQVDKKRGKMADEVTRIVEQRFPYLEPPIRRAIASCIRSYHARMVRHGTRTATR